MTITITTITGAARSYVEIFFRRKWLFITPAVILSCLSLAFSFTIPAEYRTSTIILVEEEKVNNPLISGLAISTSVRDRLETIVKVLLSRPVLEQVVSELDLDAGIEKSPMAYDDLINSLRNNVSVQLLGRDILKISSEDRDPVVCQKIANNITSLFIKHNLDLQMRETGSGIEFLRNQRDIYEKKLKESEKSLREFKEKYQGILSVRVSEELNKVMGPPMGTGASPLINTEVLRFTEYRGDLIKLNLDLKDAINNRAQLLKQLKDESEYISAERLADPVVKQLESDLANKQVELARLEVDATEKHPVVTRLKQEISEMREKITGARSEKKSSGEKEVLNPYYQNIRMELAKLDREIESLRTRLKLTELYLEEEQEKIKSIPKREEEFSGLQRDYSINSGIYADLTQKLESAYITQRLELQEKGTKFRVVEPARVPLKPFKPNRQFMTFAGACIGMLIGVGLIFLAEMTDHSFTEINQLRNFLNIPVLASISEILTIEEAEEIRAKKRIGVMSLLLFVAFSVLGGLITYIFFRKG